MSLDAACSYAPLEESTRTVYSTYVGCFSHDYAKMSDRSHTRDEGFVEWGLMASGDFSSSWQGRCVSKDVLVDGRIR